MMDIFEKAGLALEKYIEANPEKVKSDLIRMRELSKGNDIYNYINAVSDAYSFEDLKVTTEEDFEIIWCDDKCLHEKHHHSYYTDINVDIKELLYNSGVYTCDDPPPPIENYTKSKKEDLVKPTGSFFFVILAMWNSQRKQHLNLKISEYLNFHITKEVLKMKLLNYISILREGI